MKPTKKLKLTRESIRLLSKEELLGAPIAGGQSAQGSCAGESCETCEPSGIIACIPSRVHEECV